MQPPAYSTLSDKKIDRISLRGAALPDPDHPFLISPLPQFTTPLTTSNNFSFTPVPPLPELTDDLESEDDEPTDSEAEHEAATPIVVQQDLRDSNGLRRLSFLQTDGRSEHMHDSALARTGPYLDHRRARSGSSPEMYTSPSSVKVSPDTSNASPQSPPKSTTLSQSQQQVQQHASSSREGDASFSSRSTLARNPDGGVLRTRLHDLLRDSAISSSLPNMSASHFPPSFTNRETSSGRASPLLPRSDSSNTNKTPLSSSSSSSSADTAVSLLPQTTGGGKPLTGLAPICNFAPRQGFSSASTEAKKLEEERRRKLKEEKQPSTSTSTQTSNNSSNNNTIQLTPRREQPSTTTTQAMVSNSGPIPTSSTRRGQSFSGSLGRSGSIVSPTGSKEEQQHDTFTHQPRYVNHIGKTRGAIHPSVDPAGIYA